MKKLLIPALAALIAGCASKVPEAAFGAAPLEGPPPLTVVFADSSANSPDTWLWDFGDGDTSSIQNPTHVYDSTGSYDVTLIVANSFGADTLTRASYITVGELGYEKVEASGITLEWRVDGTNLDIRLFAPTRGWVAVGFDPTTSMKDANFIIGYVQGSDVFISDQYGNSNFSHEPDADAQGSNNITSKQGQETGTGTRISFTIPLDSGDPRDRALVAGQTYKVLLAYGPDNADEFTTKHATKTSVNIKI
ncbi:PKD domain-containing protein [bacterium]|nr:PKD domain-containing protein [bacterium]